jgi:hypothetical protein
MMPERWVRHRRRSGVVSHVPLDGIGHDAVIVGVKGRPRSSPPARRWR